MAIHLNIYEIEKVEALKIIGVTAHLDTNGLKG